LYVSWLGVHSARLYTRNAAALAGIDELLEIVPV
jgi:hypothetical protein